MDNDEILARFGISQRLAYGLLFQSILIIIATIISIWGIFKTDLDTLSYMTNVISLVVCILLLVYSFYGLNAKKSREVLFTTILVMYILLILMGLFVNIVDLKSPTGLLTVILLISTIFFMSEYRKNYKVANYALLVILIASTIITIFDIMAGLPWFAALKYIIIPVTIGLTYFERVQRGKYDFGI
ncbi:hypothetical protein [Methanobrevibacter sp.]|uniref:hypothetical protein n=1 Tax=Methanobrevibacter sp. TaxID=66852 RepID=UPI00388E13BB